MCVVSMVMDHFGDKWQRQLDHFEFVPRPPIPPALPMITPAEIAEFRELLDRARKYDRENNQPDCELEAKRQRIKDLAEKLGVKVEFV